MVELALRSEQGDVHAIAGEGAQGHHGLERRHSAARDDDVEILRM